MQLIAEPVSNNPSNNPGGFIKIFKSSTTTGPHTRYLSLAGNRILNKGIRLPMPELDGFLAIGKRFFNDFCCLNYV